MWGVLTPGIALWKFGSHFGTPTSNMGGHLGVWRFIPSHSLHSREHVKWLPSLPLGPQPCNPLALVASPRLGLQQREVPNIKKTCKESQGISEISFLKKNKEGENKLKVSQKSLCSKSFLLIATILNPTCKVEGWVNFKIVLVVNFKRLVHTCFFRSVVEVT